MTAITLKANSSYSRCQKGIPDPDESTLGSASCILNWLCDTGATAHMMPRFNDLVNVEQVCSINVEVADGYLVPVTAYGDVILKLVDKKGKDFTVRLIDLFYVPGLTQHLF